MRFESTQLLIILKQKTILLFDLTFPKPFLINIWILYTLKTPQNIWCPGVFRGYIMEKLAFMGYKMEARARNGSIKNGPTPELRTLNLQFLIILIESIILGQRPVLAKKGP